MTHNLAINPFHAIYFIDGNSGIELISQSYTQTRLPIDINAISGMFKAFELFINNLAYSNNFDRVQDINFKGIRIVYERYGSLDHPVLCVGVSNKSADEAMEHNLLKSLVRDFYELFAEKIQAFKGDVTVFGPFSLVLQKVGAFQPKFYHGNSTLYPIARDSPAVAGSEMPSTYS